MVHPVFPSKIKLQSIPSYYVCVDYYSLKLSSQQSLHKYVEFKFDFPPTNQSS